MDSGDTPWAVETVGLSKSFGLRRALRSLDLRLERGSTLAIFGPNGAGKTTLIKLLAGVMRPSSGRILIDGLELKDHAEEVRSHTGLLAHQSYLYGGLTAQENLEFYGRMYGVADLKERIAEVLALVDLAARRHDRVATLSRGTQQRLALARALLHHPTLLLLDEPETGLDQQALGAMWGILRREEAGRRTIVFTSHSLERALKVCDGVVILERGRLAFQGKSCELSLASLKQKYDECTAVHR